MTRRTATVLALLALGATSFVASQADAATHPSRVASAVVIGQNFQSALGCPQVTGIQLSSGGGTNYSVPSAGVITSFTTISTGGFRGLVLRVSAPGHYAIVGMSPLTLGNSLSAPTTAPARIAVQLGDRLGIDLPAGGTGCITLTGDPSDVVGYANGFDPTVSSDFVPASTQAGRFNISAVLEPDADGDGYGDVSQDGCPALAALQVPCPTPDTTVKHAPAKVVHNRVVHFKIKSTVPGSTFECKVDGGKFKTCKSSFKKTFSVGQHRVKVRATSPLGFTDATPAKVRFTVEPA
jgi:hypothetical protein